MSYLSFSRVSSVNCFPPVQWVSLPSPLPVPGCLPATLSHGSTVVPVVSGWTGVQSLDPLDWWKTADTRHSRERQIRHTLITLNLTTRSLSSSIRSLQHQKLSPFRHTQDSGYQGSEYIQRLNQQHSSRMPSHDEHGGHDDGGGGGYVEETAALGR